MVSLHACQLTLDQSSHVDWQVLLGGLLQGFLVCLQGVIFTSFYFVEYGLVALASDGTFQVNPQAVCARSNAGRILRLTAECAHFSLKLSHGSCAFGRAGKEICFNFRVLDIFGSSMKAFFAINAGLGQIVEYRDRFFIDIRHFAVPFWQVNREWMQ